MRLFWFENDDFSKPIEHEANVFIFGVVAAGPVANVSVKKLMEILPNVDERVKKSLLEQRYVDDIADSVDSVPEALKLVQGLIETLSEGGFNLTKWLSNSPEVMNSLDPASLDPAGVVDLESALGSTLGLKWDFKNDLLVFDFKSFLEKVEQQNEKFTRRSILSLVASIFDPLGIIAPLIILGKIVLQSLCKLKDGWDVIADEAHTLEFKSWIKLIESISSFSVPRCFKSADIGNIQTVEIHGFADSSKKAYSAAIYIVLRGERGTRVSLVQGKCRVAPLSPRNQSIPKLELTSCAVLIKLFKTVEHEIDMVIDKAYFWSDSSAVLSVLNRPQLRLSVFWENRIGLILTHSNASQWRHVPSALNAADIGSRGLDSKNAIEELKVWHQGPSFLNKPESDDNPWPSAFVASSVDVPEICLLADVMDDNPDPDIFNHGLYLVIPRISCYYRMKKCVAWFLRFVKFLKCKHILSDMTDLERGPLNAVELELAEVVILRLTQFQSKIVMNNQVSKSMSGCNLKPFLSKEDNLCRASGRLRHSYLSYQVKFPVILPAVHHVTDALIRYEHIENGHCGPKQLRSILQNKGFWVINAARVCFNFKRACVPCTRTDARLLSQQMADLPPERVRVSFPFEHVGVDFFGHFWVKAGRRRIKRYALIAVCCSSRAVHLEMVNDLTSDAFICGLSRFFSRRAHPVTVFSDNARTILGATAELRECTLFEEKIIEYTAQKGIRWHFHPPKGSSHAGHYERLIRSCRRTLRGLAYIPGVRPATVEFTEDNFVTFLCETERILNDRPITPVSDDPSDDAPLTPNHILLLRRNSCAPLDIKSDYRKAYQQVKEYADNFWSRWSQEYLVQLQARQKCIHPKRNLKVNDMVLLAGENLPRSQWPLARVVKVFPGDDGLVRSVEVRHKNTTKIRPINKLALVEGLS